MPTYQYACTACEHRFEAVQSFSDSSLTECPECSGKLRKLFGAVGVVFKGSGFYRTDSRSGSSTSAAATTSSSDSKPAEKKSSDTKSSSDSKSSTSAPAAAAS
ncbi:FmdB family zinc ribbon protein [Lentzea albidocapillata]|uniref:Putative regulatory protein, FmdB family n=1 Tax=Lentzea albidocapillata TaxID=40571 RepID=A0A1W2FP72_9PSEU|nr:FmdB family zinc ribbon protein [Lentzea albidocapillata]SMD23673.1 putative regulatory protein, FmdB family [Lentzea albidocapillata]